MKPAWEIALDFQGERGDRYARLDAIRDQLKSRLDKVTEALGELDWMATTVRRMQKRTADLEWIEAMRDEYRQMAEDPQEFVSPAHYFSKMADICEALLAERGATCSQ